MGPRRCAQPGCGRFVRFEAVWCDRHRGEADSPAVDVAADQQFLDRLSHGDYRLLYGEPLWQVIRQAAEERGLGDEVGALRVVLSRLLTEETDLSRLAQGVARLVNVAVQTSREQRAIEGGGDAVTGQALQQVLAELGTEGQGCGRTGNGHSGESGSMCGRPRPMRR